jgi:hypothetical protein
MHHSRHGLPRVAARALAVVRGGVDRDHWDLGDALHRHARVHDPRRDHPLQRADHNPEHVHRGCHRLRRPADRRVWRRRLPLAAAGRADHRVRRGEHALHGHGGDADAGPDHVQRRPVWRVGGDCRGRGDRRAVGRAPAARRLAHCRRRHGHGHRGQRHALHGDGRDADVPRPRPSRHGHGQFGRRHRGELPAAAGPRDQRALLRPDRGDCAITQPRRDPYRKGADGPHWQVRFGGPVSVA